MRYNTEVKKLALPEYGRNIQNMVDHCLTIEDRAERQFCAESVINIMGRMFPHLRDVNDFKHILWDHLAIMSNFELDIDYPYEVVKEEDLLTKPPVLPYDHSRMRYRHYGKTLERMILIAADMEDGEKKDYLIRMLANHMKKLFLITNKDIVDDQKIYKDLYELSEGKINVNEETCKLLDSKELITRTNPSSGGKKSNTRKGR